MITHFKHLSVYFYNPLLHTLQFFTSTTWINSTQSTLLISLSITNSIQSFIHSTITYNFSSEWNSATSTVSQVIPQVAYQSPQAPTQLITESSFGDTGFAVLVFSPGDDPIACLNKAMAFLMAVCFFRGDKGKIILVQHIRAMLLVQGEIQQVDKLELLNATTAKIEEQLAFLADPGMPGGESRKEIVENVVHTPSATTIVQDGSSFDSETVALQSNKLRQKKTLGYELGPCLLSRLYYGIWTLDVRETHDREELSALNFVSKFLGTVRFRNDQIARIMRYGDYQLGNIIISRVYYVEGLRHNLFSVGQFWSRDTNLYTISLDNMLKSSPIYLLSKASKTKSWLWHRRLSRLNFGTLNKLAKDGLARGLPRLKFQKDHLCSACALGKSKKSFHKPKAEGTNQEKLYLLHMNLYGPMRVASINGKSSLIRLRYNKTPYELMQDKKPDLSFFHVFCSLCYPTNDHEDLGKFDAKADIGIFVGYAPTKKAFRIYNIRTRISTETIHVTFDELTTMASEQFSSGTGLQGTTPVTSSIGLGSNPVFQ
ncbi:integrase, catalytic region, zinc finger, CCHC-type containing protein [Tanacetum coccineum]